MQKVFIMFSLSTILLLTACGADVHGPKLPPSAPAEVPAPDDTGRDEPKFDAQSSPDCSHEDDGGPVYDEIVVTNYVLIDYGQEGMVKAGCPYGYTVASGICWHKEDVELTGDVSSPDGHACFGKALTEYAVPGQQARLGVTLTCEKVK